MKALRGAAHRSLLSPAPPAAYLTDQTVVGVEVSVDDVHRMEVGLRDGTRLSVAVQLTDLTSALTSGSSWLPTRPVS